jgi:uncharacterized protein
MTDKASKDIIATIKKTMKKVAPQARVILYGSRARGDYHKDSDWDLLILLDKDKIEEKDQERIAFPLYDIGYSANQLISPKIYTFSEWSKRSFTIFYKNINKEGIILL